MVRSMSAEVSSLGVWLLIGARIGDGATQSGCLP
jgi:hypothetical protein